MALISVAWVAGRKHAARHHREVADDAAARDLYDRYLCDVDALTQAYLLQAPSDTEWLTAITAKDSTAGGTMPNSVGDLARRVGLDVRYYPLDQGPDSARRYQQAEQLYDACRRLINSVSEQPGSRIEVVNSFVEIGHQAGDDQVEAASRRYLATLDKKIGRVPYATIIQLYPNDLAQLHRKSIAKLIAANYLEHYQKIVKASEASHGERPTHVDAVPAKYPISFVLAHNATDSEFGGSLILHMTEHVHNDSVQLTGVWIITDPGGIMTRTFMEWFAELGRSPIRYRLKSGNLDPNGELVL